MNKQKANTRESEANFQNHHSAFTRRKKILFLVILPIVLVILGLIAYWYYSQPGTQSSSNSSEGATTSTTSTAQAQDTAYDKAVTTAETSGPAAGQAILDSALQQATSSTAKATIYSQKSSLAGSPTSGSDYTSALEYAKQADSLNPTIESAAAVASIAQGMGDNKQAITYYQLAIERIGDPTKADSMEQSSYGYYNQEIGILQDAN